MDYQTVSTVIKKYNISSRMLSYYEQAGLIQSKRVNGYPYRVFDEANIMRLQQVVILRKLQIPVKQVHIILSNPDAAAMVEIFKENIQGIDSEITALSTIKDILSNFLEKLEHLTNLNLEAVFIGGNVELVRQIYTNQGGFFDACQEGKLEKADAEWCKSDHQGDIEPYGHSFLKPDLLSGNTLLELTSSLSLMQKNIKESISMNELNQAAEALNTHQETKEMSMKPETTVAMIFNGNCRQAMEFYAKVFNLEGMTITTYREIPQDPSNPLSESDKDRVAVGFLQINELKIRFFDCMPASTTFGASPFAAGNNIMMHLEIMNPDEAKKIFHELSQGGTVLEEWPEPFYAAFNGITKDKFGVVWNILGH